MDDDGTSKTPTGEATWGAFYSMLGPYAIANFILIGALALFVFEPSVYDPSTYWVIAAMAIMFLVAGVFIVRGTLRHKNIRKSAKEDRRRISLGFPWTQKTRSRKRRGR